MTGTASGAVEEEEEGGGGGGGGRRGSAGSLSTSSCTPPRHFLSLPHAGLRGKGKRKAREAGAPHAAAAASGEELVGRAC